MDMEARLGGLPKFSHHVPCSSSLMELLHFKEGLKV